MPFSFRYEFNNNDIRLSFFSPHLESHGFPLKILIQMRLLSTDKAIWIWVFMDTLTLPMAKHPKSTNRTLRLGHCLFILIHSNGWQYEMAGWSQYVTLSHSTNSWAPTNWGSHYDMVDGSGLNLKGIILTLAEPRYAKRSSTIQSMYKYINTCIFIQFNTFTRNQCSRVVKNAEEISVKHHSIYCHTFQELPLADNPQKKVEFAYA